MKPLVAIVLMLAGLIHAMGEPVANGKTPVQSHTGQFAAMAAPNDPASPPKFLLTGKNMLTLEPALLVISCERIKQVLYRELDAAGPWEGKVFLSLHHARSGDDPVTIVAEKGRNTWSYRVD